MATTRLPEIERLPWAEAVPAMSWRQGEHVSLIGPTGTGKSTAMLGLLPQRQYVNVIGTKVRDETLNVLIDRQGYTRIREWPPPPRGPRKEQRIILWPDFRRPEDQAIQRYEIDRGLREMFTEGGWCVAVDEAFYLCKILGLTALLEMYWTQGRSMGLSLVASTQRPAHVPLWMYDQASHLLLWRDNDPANLQRIGGFGGGLDPAVVRGVVKTLPLHDCLYINTRTGAMFITRAEKVS
jgi:energy-coupling factor transporter ATP-binding protein EcfA2